MKLNSIALACGLLLSIGLQTTAQAQQLTATTKSQVTITKGASPASLKRKLKEDLELKAVKNLLEASFAVKFTPQVEAKLPELVELLSDSIQISMDPADGEVLSGRATITVASAKLKEYLTNKGIGAGDIAAKSAKILVSIDEFIGVATNNDGQTATQTETTYSHDKSSFSDTSAKASNSQSESASSASATKKNIGASSKDAVAVAGRQASAVAAQQDTAVAGRRDTAVAYQGNGSSAAGASSAQYAGASKSQYAAAQSSQYAGAASSERAFSDKSEAASASRSASASASSSDQKNVQQQTDKVNISVKTKLPEFNNAKPMGAQDRVLVSRLSGEFQNNGLRLVAENDLRAEGGRILPIFEITNNGRIAQFVELIQKKNIEADVWATGQANYTIVGTVAGVTQCNGNLAVQGRFIEGNEIFFEDALQAAASSGGGDQDCRGRLGIALATSLAKVLGQRANKELNARSSRGGVYTLYLYSASQLKRADRRQFQDLLEKVDGIQLSEPTTKESYMSISVQYAGKLKDTIDRMLDKLPWEKAVVLSKANKICVGIEGMGACPAEFK